MQNKCFLLLYGLIIITQVNAQFSQAARDSIQALTEVDYNLMLNQLGIDPSDIRHGPSGNPADPNAANTDESKAKTYLITGTRFELQLNGKQNEGRKYRNYLSVRFMEESLRMFLGFYGRSLV